MLIHRELKVYFCLSSSCGFLLHEKYERSKKAIMITQNQVYPFLLKVEELIFWDPPKISESIEGNSMKLCTPIALLKVYQNT